MDDLLIDLSSINQSIHNSIEQDLLLQQHLLSEQQQSQSQTEPDLLTHSNHIHDDNNIHLDENIDSSLDELLLLDPNLHGEANYEDTSRFFDRIGTRYQNKDIFIKSCNEQAEIQGFRLWVGEGRPVKDAIAGGRVELACYKFRHKGPDGKRTRVGGCRFVLKAVQLSDVVDELGNKAWELAGGHFVHNHELGNLKPPRRPNAPRDPNALPKQPKTKKQKAAQLQHDTEIIANALNGDYISNNYDSTNWPSLYKSTHDNGDISVDSHAAINQAISAVNLTNITSLTQNAIASGSGSNNNNNSFPMDPSLEDPIIHQTATNAAELLLLQLHASLPVVQQAPIPFHLSTQSVDSFGSISVADFLREQNPDLEQYADAFRNAGCTDLGSLLRLPEKDVRDFIDEDLPKLCPELVVRPFHRRLLLTVISDYRTIKSLADVAAATSSSSSSLNRETVDQLEAELNKGLVEEQLNLIGLNVGVELELELNLGEETGFEIGGGGNKRRLEEEYDELDEE